MANERKDTGDGIALRSMPHPTAPWWRRILFWFQRGRRLSEDAIENAEIEIDPSKKSGGFRINRPKV